MRNASFTLGVTFMVNDRIFECPPIVKDLEILNRFSFKPQQELIMLRTMLMPRYNHALVLGKIYDDHLCKIDQKV